MLKAAFTPSHRKFGRRVLFDKEGETLEIIAITGFGYQKKINIDLNVIGELVASTLECYVDFQQKGFVSSGCIHSIEMENGRVLELNGDELCLEILELDCQDSDSSCEEIGSIQLFVEDVPLFTNSIEEFFAK